MARKNQNNVEMELNENINNGEMEMNEQMNNIMEEVREEVQLDREGRYTFEEAMDAIRSCQMTNENIKELRTFVKTLKLEKAEDGGRKMELLALLRSEGRMSIKQLSEAMGISTKNVSSLLLYLKKEGFRICTDCEGRKFIEE